MAGQIRGVSVSAFIHLLAHSLVSSNSLFFYGQRITAIYIVLVTSYSLLIGLKARATRAVQDLLCRDA